MVARCRCSVAASFALHQRLLLAVRRAQWTSMLGPAESARSALIFAAHTYDVTTFIHHQVFQIGKIIKLEHFNFSQLVV